VYVEYVVVGDDVVFVFEVLLVVVGGFGLVVCFDQVLVCNYFVVDEFVRDVGMNGCGCFECGLFLVKCLGLGFGVVCGEEDD